MSAFLIAQNDYLLFLSGVGFLTVAMHAWNLRSSGDHVLPWGYLAVFGLLWTAVDWVHTIGLVYLPPGYVTTATHLIAAAAFLFLVEFWRKSAERLGRGRRPWILVPPALVIIGGVVSGQAGIAIAVTYVLSIVAAGSAAYALFVHATRHAPEVRRPLAYAAIALGAYAILGMFAENRVGVFPMNVLNQDACLSIVGLPVQPFRTAASLLFAWQLGTYYQKRTTAVLDTATCSEFRRLRWLTTAVLLITFVAGWVATQQLGATRQRQEDGDLISQARLAAAAVDSQAISELTGSSTDETSPAYLRVQRQMSRMLDATTRNIFMYVMGAHGNDVVILVEGTPLRYDGVPDDPGTIYAEASPELRAAAAKPREFVEGPLSDEYGTWYSGFAPVRLPDGSAIALLGIDREADAIDAAVAEAPHVGVLSASPQQACAGVVWWRR